MIMEEVGAAEQWACEPKTTLLSQPLGAQH